MSTRGPPPPWQEGVSSQCPTHKLKMGDNRLPKIQMKETPTKKSRNLCFSFSSVWSTDLSLSLTVRTGSRGVDPEVSKG